jgi:hypothetical protein
MRRAYFAWERHQGLSAVLLQLSVKLPCGINTGSKINRFFWSFASQNMLIIYLALCVNLVLSFTTSRVLRGLNVHIMSSLNLVHLFICIFSFLFPVFISFNVLIFILVCLHTLCLITSFRCKSKSYGFLYIQTEFNQQVPYTAVLLARWGAS